ncbi:E3 ubiquitin-protein ligase SPL2 [Camellia lanceoleosa]|uniref:E3 ubiquitin-protein ligase SPL2 n=1 Tax=Camellia lanceoleosa TaxID=1840588 RepID=A0ACC0IJH6_9ERIC|nr:E3 ubiquitin-protein ligase SPL2 [Camellia lanceoleosa]
MLVHKQVAAAILSQIALAANGAVLGITLAYIVVRSILKFTAAFSALRKIRGSIICVSDLRYITSQSEGSNSSSNDSDGGKLVIESGEKGIILHRIQTCIYNELRGLLDGLLINVLYFQDPGKNKNLSP